MKKLLSLALALVMILSMSVTAFAASDVPSVLYIDVAGIVNSEKTIGRVGLFLYSQSESGQDLEDETMTHVSGTIYSYDISSVLDPYHWASYTIYYADGTHEYQANTTVFESGKNLFTATDGTWSVYEEAAAPSVTNGSQNVTGKYVAGAESGTIYGVDISWGSMAFTYTDSSRGTWNAETHRYEGAANAAWSWEEGANEITVTNHSNDGITVTPSYTKDTGYESASMAFGNAPLTLATADNGENGAAGTATNGTITVTPGGSVPAGTSGRIGQITLSIAGADDSPTGGETTDEKAVITGVEFKAGDTTYKRGDTVTLTSNSVVTLIAKGTNLQNGIAYTNMIFYAPNVVISVTNEDWEINTDGTEATCIIYYNTALLSEETTAYEILYTNDGDTTRTGSGVKILYEA